MNRRLSVPPDVDRLRALLMQAGWLPPTPNSCQWRLSPQRNLLPLLRNLWDSSAESSDDGKRRWLNAACAKRQSLTYVAHAVGGRLLWWPKGPIYGSLVGVVSSRLGRRSRRDDRWFNAFRGVVTNLDRRRDVLLSSVGTTCHPFLEHVSRAEDFPMVSIRLSRHTDVAAWLHGLPRLSVSSGACETPVMASPAISAQSRAVDVPQRDELVFDMADHLIVLRVNARGNLSRLLSRRARWRARDQDDVKIVLADTAPAHLPLSQPARLLERSRRSRCIRGGTIRSESVRGGIAGPTTLRHRKVFHPGYLCHWTRSCAGPWPDEPREQYLDRLIFGQGEERSAFMTLRRIATTQRLLATRRWIRAGIPVVAFTRQSLDDFRSLHVYRAHLCRWDFVPYGICIDLEWLSQRGARPVIYGDEADWQRLAEEQRPFFQLRATRTAGHGRRVDWTVEQEWRHMGDVDLRLLPPQKGLIFVPDAELAAKIALYSRWKVVVVDC